MTKVAAFHTDSDMYRPEDKLVYHDNDECGYLEFRAFRGRWVRVGAVRCAVSAGV